MRRTTGRSKAIFVFGESRFDALAIVSIAAAARPDLPVPRAINRPPTLRRITELPKHKKRASVVARTIKVALKNYEVKAVISHRDLDEVEPADDPKTKSKDECAHCNELQVVTDIGVIVVATAPAWEMEAWWLMWPEQVAKVRPCWRRLRDRTGERVDRITNVKEVLKSELRPVGRSTAPEYSETDAPRIAAKIREDGVARAPKGRSIAFDRFLANLELIRL